MRQRHKHADVIIAWAEGEDVQVWDKGPKRWCDVTTSTPAFIEDWEYRIKPPAKKYRVALFNNNNGDVYTNTADTPAAAGYEQHGFFVRWLTDWIEYEE